MGALCLRPAVRLKHEKSQVISISKRHGKSKMASEDLGWDQSFVPSEAQSPALAQRLRRSSLNHALTIRRYRRRLVRGNPAS